MNLFFYLLFFIIPICLFATDSRPLVCLNMIVKDESAVIERCLASAKPMIDYWVIVDTGSTDGTQEIIRKFMKSVPGELHERPWKNFEHNRTEALNLAKGKGDYLLFIDADEVFEYEPNFQLPKLDKDFYYMTTHYSGTHYARIQFVNNHIPWEWKGVLHEAVVSPVSKTSELIEGVYNKVYTDGARSKDPQKYQKDAKTLEDALEKDPGNTRYTFYLAQSYKDAGNPKKALETYEKRIAMGGWEEEVFIAKYNAAQMEMQLNYPEEKVIKSFYEAYRYRPSRVEPLIHLVSIYRKNNQFAEGYLISKAALSTPLSKDALFVEKWIDDYGMLLECSICAYWIGKYEECRDLTEQILSKKQIPQNVKECAERNLAFAKSKLLN